MVRNRQLLESSEPDREWREGRSKAAFKTWLVERPKHFARPVEIVKMDRFTGFKIAAAEGLPDVRTVMDPFHVVRLAGDAMDGYRRRVQRTLHCHRDDADD